MIEKNNELLLEAIKEALIYSRLYGKCFLLIETDNYHRLKLPVRRESNLRGFSILFDIQEVDGFYTVDDIQIHPSRIIEIRGVKSYSKGDDDKNDSVLQGLFLSLQDYIQNNNNAKFILQNLSYLSLGITNLAQLNKTEIGREKVRVQLENVNFNRSIHHLITHDKDLESVSFISQSLAGVKDIIEEIKQIFIAETDYPVEELFEKSPNSSLGSGTQNQLVARYLWLQRCQTWTKNNALPYYLEFFNRTRYMEGIRVNIPFELSLNPLEEADINQKLADIVSGLYKNGIISFEEARQVYKNDKVSFNIKLLDAIVGGINDVKA